MRQAGRWLQLFWTREVVVDQNMSCLLVYFLSDCLLTLRSRSVSVVDFKMFNKYLFFVLFSLSFNTEVICVQSALAWRWDHWWGWVITVIIIISSFAAKTQFYIRHSLLFELVLFLLLERLKHEVSIIGERCFYWLNYVCEPSYNFRKLQSCCPCCLAKMEITKFSFLLRHISRHYRW